MSKKKKGRRGRRRVSPRTPPKKREVRLKKVRDHPWLIVGVSAGILLSAVYSVSLFSPTLIAHENSILRLPVLSHVGNVPHILSRDFLLFSSGQFRPLSYVLVAIVRTFVAPENLLFWHVWLLAFHIVNTLLVFAIARHFSHRLAVTLTAAAVFGLHPLCTVIVNDINQFYMLLGLTLSLGSFKAYLSFSRNGSKTLYSVAVGLFALAILTARPAVCLGLVLLAYELLHERCGLKRVLLRLFPFALAPLLLLPLWVWHAPHPIHYKYVAMHEGSFWHGLFSVTGATGQYGGGLVLTRGIPVALHETVARIFRWDNAKFLFWGGVNLVLIVGAAFALARRQWAALGVLLIFIVMIPYASVAYNRVVDYVSWSYLYFPLVGLALFVGGLYEILLRVRARHLRVGFRVAFLAICLFLAGRSVRLNLYARSPLAYWSHVHRLNEDSQTVPYEVGKAYLSQGQLPDALHWFFAPMVRDLKYPCLAMARYYYREGNPLASAIHLRFGSIEQRTGLILEDYCEMAGDLLLAAGALDHAEENFGKILMVDPFNTGAMMKLARVWFLKGFVGEAHRMMKRARALAPNDKEISRIQEEFREKERAWQENPQPLRITPPGPDWLRYVLTEIRRPSLRPEIVALSDTADPNDGVIQLEATISLLEDKKYKAAASKAKMALYGLSGNAYACAAACRAFALAGDVKQAIQIGIHAVSLDSKSDLAWTSLSLALALEDKPDAATQEFVKAVTQHPVAKSVFYYNLALQKKRIGENREASELFEKALEAQPNNVEALAALGETLLSLGLFEQATKPLQKCVALRPSDPKNHANLGWAFLNQGKNAEGAEALRTAVKLDPKNAVYHTDLGGCLARLEHVAEAMQEFRRAIELAPILWDAHYNLANLLVKTEDLSEAVAEYREVVKIKPAHQYIHYNLGVVLNRLGRTDEAIGEYREAIRRNPNFAGSYTELVDLHCKRGEYNLAWDLVERAEKLGVKLDPDTLATLRELSPDRKKPTLDGSR